MIDFLILLFLTPFIIAILQAVLTRILKGNSTVSNQKIVIFCALLGHLPMGVLAWRIYLGRLSGEELFTASLYAFVLYNLLSYCYFHIFNMSETARRIRMPEGDEAFKPVIEHFAGAVKRSEVIIFKASRLI